MKAIHTIWRPAAAFLAVAGLVGTAVYAARPIENVVLTVTADGGQFTPSPEALVAFNYTTGFEAGPVSINPGVGFIARSPLFVAPGTHVVPPLVPFSGYINDQPCAVGPYCWGVSSAGTRSFWEAHIDTVHPFNPGGQHLRLSTDRTTRTNVIGFGIGVDARLPANADVQAVPSAPNTVSLEVAIDVPFGMSYTIQPQHIAAGFRLTQTLFHYNGGIYTMDDACGAVPASFMPFGIDGTQIGWDATGGYQNFTIGWDMCKDGLLFYYGGVRVFPACVLDINDSVVKCFGGPDHGASCVLNTDCRATCMWTPGTSTDQLLIFGDNYPGSNMDVDDVSITMQATPPCGDGFISYACGEQCELGAGEDANCPGRCLPDCTCDPICTATNPCPLVNGANGPYLTSSGFYSYTPSSPFISVDDCGSTTRAGGALNTMIAVFDAGGQVGYNDDCNTGQFGDGSDPTASCYDYTSPYAGGSVLSCTCVANTGALIIEADSFGSPPEAGSSTIINVNKKTVCISDCNGNGVDDTVDIANCPPGDDSCADCNSDGIPNGCEGGACCLDPNGDSIYEGCIDTSEPACTLASGIFRGYCKHCPTQNVSIIIEPGGGVFVHRVGPPIDCLAVTTVAGGGCPPGGPFYDAWKSVPDASMCHNFGASGQSIPADFFDPGSDVFDGSVCMAGVPLGLPGYGEADTLIQRSADPFDRCGLPPATPVNVEIDIFALSLGGTAPMTVTYNGGQNPELWTVAVDLSSIAPPSGTLTATKTHCNGGTYTSLLYVQPRFTFTKVSDPGQIRVLDTGLAGIPYVILDQQTPAPWVHDVDPNLGLTGDPCTHFHAGIDDQVHQTACDCNENLTRDKCEIEQGAADCNLNQVLDECDLFTCNDANGCTNDVCGGTMCVFTPNAAPCDDGNVCTTDDTCSAGACVGGPPLDCDDDNVCTDDSCDPPTTGCVHVDNTALCDDGLTCTDEDVCAGGECHGVPKVCTNNNVCDGVETCVEPDGCTNPPDLVYPDEFFCNGVEICDPIRGVLDQADPCDPDTQECYEEDDTCFDLVIPTVSEWGLVILTLLLLTGAKIYFSRRQATA